MSEARSSGGAIPEENTEEAAKPGAKATAKAGAGAKATAEGAQPPAERRNLPPVPEGHVLFENTADHLVRFTIRDGENTPREVRVEPGRFISVPAQYADIVPNRAPQLRRA